MTKNKKRLISIIFLLALFSLLTIFLIPSVNATSNTGNLGSFIMPNSGNVVDFNAVVDVGGYISAVSMSIGDSSNNTIWSYSGSLGNSYSTGNVVTIQISSGSPTSLSLTGGNTYYLNAVFYNVVGGPTVPYTAGSASIDYTPTHQITITSSPTGSGFVTVDGTSYTTPHTFTWTESSTHTIAATSTVSGGTGIQYVYSSWSDSGAQSHTYTVPGTDATVTANYQTQYYLTVSSSYGTPSGSGWYNAGATANFDTSSPVSGGAGTQYVFSSWSGTGSGSYTGSTKASSVTMNNAITETSNWITQFYITINANGHGSPTQSSQWVNSGGSISVSVTSPESGGTGIQYVCTSSTTQSINPVTSSQTITFNWKTQYYLTVTSSYGSPTGQAWYDSASTATFGVTPVSGYTFNGWTGTGTGSYTGSSLAQTITMNNAITETASWTPVSPPTPTPTPTPGPTAPPGSASNAGGVQGGSIFDIMAQNSSASIPELGNLVGYWAFDEGSGTTAHDSSGSSNTGTLVNSPSWVTGKYGDALNFNGVNQEVTVTQSSTTELFSTGTVSAWFKESSYGIYILVSCEDWGVGHYGYTLGLYNHVAFIDFSKADAQLSVSYTGNFADNQWHLLTGVWNGSYINLYLDGILVGTPGAQTFNPVYTGYPLVFGNVGSGTNYYFNGLIDNVLIYNTSLTQIQIAQLYNYTGSSYTASTQIPNFQSFSTTVTLYQGAIWYSSNNCWDAPTYDFNTGYFSYGVNYIDPVTNTTVPGWYTKISIVGGAAGTFSSSPQAYVELQCQWFDGGNLTKTDYLFVAYDAYQANDTTTQFELYINLWLSNQNYNTMVGGAVTAVYYGTTETGWGPWSSWGPVDGLLSQSTFYAPLYNSTGGVITASQLQNNVYNVGIFNVWTSIAKTGPGYGPYSDDLHVWATTCKNLQFEGLPIGATLVGINTPSILPTSTPNNPVGIFGELGNSITSSLNSMTQALSTMVSSASGVGTAALDKAFSAIGVSDATQSITTYASTIGSYFSSSVSYMSSTIVPIFTGIASFGLSVVSWIGSFITWIINVITYFWYILNGTPIPNNSAFGNFGSYGNILGQTVSIAGVAVTTLEMLAATGALWLLLIIWWMDSIDKRAKQYGGGWMSFFMSDVQNIISVLSFIFDMAWRVITTTISLGTQFLNLFL